MNKLKTTFVVLALLAGLGAQAESPQVKPIYICVLDTPTSPAVFTQDVLNLNADYYDAYVYSWKYKGQSGVSLTNPRFLDFLPTDIKISPRNNTVAYQTTWGPYYLQLNVQKHKQYPDVRIDGKSYHVVGGLLINGESGGEVAGTTSGGFEDKVQCLYFPQNDQ